MCAINVESASPRLWLYYLRDGLDDGPSYLRLVSKAEQRSLQPAHNIHRQVASSFP
jgi:hypothetical protein